MRKDFSKVLKEIKNMRKNRNAPIDIYNFKTNVEKNISKKKLHYQILINYLLSSQTKDKTVHNVMKKLIDYGLDIKTILDTKIKKIEDLIYQVSFYKQKARYIKETTKILHEKYNDDIPKTLKELKTLKGIGTKIAILILQNALNKNKGVSVDIHVHRICNRIGLVKTKSPDQTSKELEEWLPKKYWKEFNPLLVGFGQQVCKSKPKCSICSVKKYCDYYKRNN